MSKPSIITLSFVFDNQADQILLLQIGQEGPLKRKHSGLKGEIGPTEGIREAAIRNIGSSAGIAVNEAVLRGVVKTINSDNQSTHIYFIYESSMSAGEVGSHPHGRLKWVDILNIFNLSLESLTKEVMPFLLDGESFFEGTIHLTNSDEVESCDIQICNSI